MIIRFYNYKLKLAIKRHRQFQGKWSYHNRFYEFCIILYVEIINMRYILESDFRPNDILELISRINHYTSRNKS